MTDVAATDVVDSHDPVHGDHGHPPIALFVKTGLILAVITAIEVAWSYLPWGHATGGKALLEVGGLLLMMMIKFVIVAAVFMHLKFDKPILTQLFYGGFLLACAVYVAALSAFEFWSSGPPGFQPK